MGTSRAIAVANFFCELAFVAIKILPINKKCEKKRPQGVSRP
jgi:hypothetical protein